MSGRRCMPLRCETMCRPKKRRDAPAWTCQTPAKCCVATQWTVLRVVCISVCHNRRAFGPWKRIAATGGNKKKRTIANRNQAKRDQARSRNRKKVLFAITFFPLLLIPANLSLNQNHWKPLLRRVSGAKRLKSWKPMKRSARRGQAT